jgi:hypothetical protein
MKSIILCAFLTSSYLLVNAQAPVDTAFKPQLNPNGVAIYPNIASSNITVTSLQDVKVTAYQDAATISMNNTETLVTPSITKVILPSYIQQIKIYDMADVLKKTLNYNNSVNTQVNVDVSNLSAGIYFVETVTNQKTIRKQKIVIER